MGVISFTHPCAREYDNCHLRRFHYVYMHLHTLNDSVLRGAFAKAFLFDAAAPEKEINYDSFQQTHLLQFTSEEILERIKQIIKLKLISRLTFKIESYFLRR